MKYMKIVEARCSLRGTFFRFAYIMSLFQHLHVQDINNGIPFLASIYGHSHLSSDSIAMAGVTNVMVPPWTIGNL